MTSVKISPLRKKRSKCRHNAPLKNYRIFHLYSCSSHQSIPLFYYPPPPPTPVDDFSQNLPPKEKKIKVQTQYPPQKLPDFPFVFPAVHINSFCVSFRIQDKARQDIYYQNITCTISWPAVSRKTLFVACQINSITKQILQIISKHQKVKKKKRRLCVIKSKARRTNLFNTSCERS